MAEYSYQFPIVDNITPHIINITPIKLRKLKFSEKIILDQIKIITIVADVVIG